jgi:hypothetical protein
MWRAVAAVVGVSGKSGGVIVLPLLAALFVLFVALRPVWRGRESVYRHRAVIGMAKSLISIYCI